MESKILTGKTLKNMNNYKQIMKKILFTFILICLWAGLSAQSTFRKGIKVGNPESHIITQIDSISDEDNDKVKFYQGNTQLGLDLKEGSFSIGGTAITPSATEINYVNGVTSAIQTQLTARQYFHYDYIIEEVSGTTYARPNPNSSYTAYSNAVPSTVINSAISQLTSGGVIWFKEGTFDNCDSIVVDKNNIIFQGSGQRKTILKLKASFDAAKKFSDGFIQVTGTDVTIRDLEIDGNAANQTKIDHGTSDAVAIINGIESEDAHRLTIDNVYIHDFTETCIFATGCDYGKILNSTIEDGFWNGITLGWGTQDWVVDKNIVQGSTPVLGDSSSIGDVGIALYGRNHRVTNNLIKNIVGTRGYDNSRAGISLEFSSDGTDLNEAARPAGMFISNNRFEGSGMTSGVANNGLGSGSKSCIITNNYFDSCKYAINFWGDSAKITDNKIYAYQIGSYTYGIYIQEGDYNFVSTNEVIVPTTGSGNYPILIVENGANGANYNTVTNNTLIGGTYYSIGVSGSNCTGNEVIGNIFDDDSAGDYDIYDTGTGTIKKGNYDRHTARWTPDPSLNVGDVGSFNDVTIDSLRKVGNQIAAYVDADTSDIYVTYANREDITEKISPIYEMGLLGSSIKAMTLGMKISDASGYSSFADGVTKLTAVLVDRTISATGVKWEQYTKGDYTGDKLNGIAIYSESGGTLTLIDSCTRNVNFWKETANTLVTSAFTNGPLTLTEGVYWVAMTYNQSAQTTAPTVGGTSFGSSIFNKMDFSNNKKISGTATVGWSWPATINFSTVTESTTVSLVFLY